MGVWFYWALFCRSPGEKKIIIIIVIIIIPNHKLIICVLGLKEGLYKRKMEFVNRGLRIAEKGADVRRQAGTKTVDEGRRQEAWTSKSAAWTGKAGSRNIIEQEVLLRELSSRQRMLRGRSFVRIWKLFSFF